MQGSPAMIARRLIHRMLADSWTRSLFSLTRLNRRFLIRADDPDTLFEQSNSVFIQAQHWASTLKEGFGILDVLPGMETPGTKLLGGEPASNRPG